MHFGGHHQSLRRRGKLATRAKTKTARRIDALTYLVSFTSITFTLDQVRIIWLEHNAAGVSVLAWGFYTFSAIVWLVYGLVHRERVVIIINSIWVGLNFVIAFGAYLYR